MALREINGDEARAQLLTTPIRKVWRKGTKRGARCINGRSESDWVCKLEADTAVRRIYRDWGNADTSAKHSRDWIVPLVVLIKGIPHTLSPAQEEQVRAAD